MVTLRQVSEGQMYHTWFFQKRLAKALDAKLKEFQLLACFSQQKDELILSFGNQHHEFHIRADMSTQAGILSFQNSFARTRKNSVDLFNEPLDKRVISVEAFAHERSFSIKMEDKLQLIFKMHGHQSNILLIANDRVIKIFRNNLLADVNLKPSNLHNPMDISDSTVLKLLGKKNHSLFNSQKRAARQFVDQLNSNAIYIGLKEDQPYLSLVETESPVFITNDSIEASNRYADLHHRYFRLVKEKQQITRMVEKKMKQSENYIRKAIHKLDEITNQRNLGEIANILMANLHSLCPNKKEVTLDDFYTSSPITIMLNSKLSPQKNAENYYRKSKNKKIELQKLEESILSKQKESKKLQRLLNDIAAIDTLKILRAFNASNFGKAAEKKKALLPYHKLLVDGYDVLIGKHAKSNDLLVQKVAKSNDLWLHAKDVPGSHVVIREKPGSKFPAPLIEKVAALAAWYSKRKTESLCPVIVTPTKFVRKTKNTPPGQVVVEKEDVIMVVPSNNCS